MSGCKSKVTLILSHGSYAQGCTVLLQGQYAIAGRHGDHMRQGSESPAGTRLPVLALPGRSSASRPFLARLAPRGGGGVGWSRLEGSTGLGRARGKVDADFELDQSARESQPRESRGLNFSCSAGYSGIAPISVVAGPRSRGRAAQGWPERRWTSGGLV